MHDKELLERHPLFRRLSGQIVWYLFEERDIPPETIDAYFASLEACRIETLDLMRRLLDPPADLGRVHLHVRLVPGDENAPPCPRCGRMHDILIPADHPRLLEYLPPYGLGCRARGRLLAEAEAAHLLTRQPAELPEPPGHELSCPSEWLFEYDWTSRQG